MKEAPVAQVWIYHAESDSLFIDDEEILYSGNSYDAGLCLRVGPAITKTVAEATALLLALEGWTAEDVNACIRSYTMTQAAPPQRKITADQVVEAYVKTRDQLDAMKKEFDKQCEELKAKQEKREAWLKANLTADDKCAFIDPATSQVVVGAYPTKVSDYVIQRYVEDRDQLAANSKAAAELSAPLNIAQVAREQWLKNELTSTGAEGLKTTHGTAFWETGSSATVADATEFMAWVHEDWDARRGFLNNAVNKTAVKARLDDKQPVPPGVDYKTFRSVKVRRA